VGFREHEAVSTRTAADGPFKLAPDHSRGAAMIIPFEFTPCGGVLYVTAPAYDAFQKDIGARVYSPIQLPDIMLAKKKPN